MKCLITGANGFIGKSLVKKLLLNSDSYIYALVTSKIDLEDITSDRLKCIEMTFDSYDKIFEEIGDDVDVVFHLAWKGLCGPAAKDLDTQLENVSATSKLLAQAKLMHAKKVILASSMNTLEVREFLNHPNITKPRTVYTHVAAKLTSEIISRVFCADNSIEFNVALLAMVYGENNKSKMIPNVFIYSLLNGIKPKLITGNNLYDLVYIDDVVEGMIAIANKGINNKTYYIGHEEIKPFKDLFLEIKNIINPNIEIQFGAYPEDNAINFDLVNRRELTIDTGWFPKSDFAESIKKTAEWIRNSNIDFYN